MPFAFDPSDRSTTAAVRRIAAELLDGALADLARPGQPAPGRVHGLRKRIKKLRGLLRLVAPRFEAFRFENAALRDAGRLISDLRDAEVRRATFARLAVPGLPDAAGLGALQRHLDAERDRIAAQDAGPALADLHLSLAAVRARLPDWRVRGKGFAPVAAGLARTWTQAEAARHAAAAERAGAFRAEPFHDWRKRVKAHWYHARLLAPIWPAMMAPHVAAADDLGEALGLHNDIAVLMTHLTGSDAAAAHPAAFAALADHALAERARIADAALREGARLFAGSGRALARRWAVWHADWQAG
ncbi:MAG: CHAD domain-containing protein [Gemmobacter sp.]